jgi:S-layer homology domain
MTGSDADRDRSARPGGRAVLAAAYLAAMPLLMATPASGQILHHPVQPHGLEVDVSPSIGSDGNGVFEPGESVVTAPQWRNVSSFPIFLRGTATSFNGPDVASYSLLDDQARYGIVGPGTSASCRDERNCYGTAVLPFTADRPLHWDAAMKEKTNADASHTWTLHLGDSFHDVPRSSPFYRSIETLLHNGVTSGCGDRLYCPQDLLTRDQLAVYLLASKEGPGYAPPACVEGQERFDDVPAGSPFCRWIEELSRREIVGGCTPALYCPEAPVTRQEMAYLSLFTKEGHVAYPICAEGTPRIFADVDHLNPFCSWIEELARRGVVGGCGGGNYCPLQDTTREQAAVFMVGTFELRLYEP